MPKPTKVELQRTAELESAANEYRQAHEAWRTARAALNEKLEPMRKRFDARVEAECGELARAVRLAEDELEQRQADLENLMIRFDMEKFEHRDVIAAFAFSTARKISVIAFLEYAQSLNRWDDGVGCLKVELGQAESRFDEKALRTFTETISKRGKFSVKVI